jgi:uncharacterized membrane protein YqjE
MDSRVVHDESIGGLLRGILGDFRTLLQEELALARLEISEQAARMRTAALSLGIAAVALLFGLTFLLIAAATGVADVLDWPVWAGFLAVAVVLSVAGLVLLASARKKLSQVSAVPENTLSSMKENAEWISKRLSSAQR